MRTTSSTMTAKVPRSSDGRALAVFKRCTEAEPAGNSAGWEGGLYFSKDGHRYFLGLCEGCNPLLLARPSTHLSTHPLVHAHSRPPRPAPTFLLRPLAEAGSAIEATES